uniref:HTH-type transcriptional regulator MalT n=1 Tax=Candidatus Methanophagaceae archaeon ANME-1 ERB6 TaxID=2759912 RepID=A0A7G9YY61_9EURY|nr:HTH-type transcriptional regulator MalT [Methanosarcinales archaeon ANME-1 ERB6]
MKLGWEGLKDVELIGNIAKIAGVASPLINITAGVFANGLTEAIEIINTARTRKEIFKKAKEKAKEKLPALKDKFEKLTPKDLPDTFLHFRDEDEFCTKNPALCEKITQEGCKLFYRVILEEFSRYAHKSDEFWQEFITQLIQDQSGEIEEVRKEIEKRGIKQEDFWRKLFDRYFEKLLENIRPRHIITYFPPASPDVADFVNRDAEQNNLEELIRQKKHMIIIQGIAGIGKTQIAAKIMENIKKRDYITYWKEMRNVDTFDSVTRDLAGFLRNNNDSELADYIEGDGTEHEIIINILLNSLKEKQYALFFDNYQVVENKEIHDLFKRFKDKLTNSTIIITTREPPQFVNPVDKIQSKVKEENVEGFDLEATKKYLEQQGVEVSKEQLVKIDQKIGGHPLSLLMFASLSGEREIDEIDEIIENLPETGIEEYLYDEIFKRLTEEEQEVLEALSIFRTAVTADACIQVSKTAKVKMILMSLIRKLLVKRKKDLYYLHDLIREFSYNLIDKTKEYHKRAGEYYSSLEKMHENITETCYHLIKYYDAVNDRIIEYLMDTPADAYTHFVILNILDENKVESLKFFDLIKRIYDIGSVDIKKLTITSLVNNKELDIDETISIIEEIIDKDENSDITYFAIYNLTEFTNILPERVLGILNGIIKNPKEKKYVYAILNMLQDSGFKHDGTISILKQIIYADSVNINLIHRRTAYNILEDWGIALSDISKVDPSIFREMNVEEVFEFIDKYLSAEKKVIFINDGVLHFILCELYKINPDVSREFMKKYLKIPASPNFEQISEVLANPMYYNPEIINDFLAEENDWIIRFTGFMALEFNINNEFKNAPVEKHEETKKVSITILKTLLNDEDPLLSEMAKVAYDRTKKTKKVEKTKLAQKIKNKVTRKMMNLVDLKMIQRYLVAGFELTTQHQTLLFWLLYNALLPNTNPTETFGLLHAAGRAGVIEKNIVQFVYNEVKNNPCDAIEILNKFGIKSDYFMSRVGAIVGIDMIGRICPEKALETYESLLSTIERELKFVLLGSGSTGLLRNFRDRPEGPEKERIKSILKRLKQDEDKEVSAFADMILNGIQFKDAC